ncbi:hypothetical protein DEO72_LG9g2493 [Vigna unguiculata]|uniref:Uncharacterized protein n=1 Tax=Vigna unguiculata TaxID=3917 RepID=A0A4D6N0Z2_VIGUN|nr:hypothetical protein DEO72_LG9g2493 [Vigna unguiculata]
MVVRVVREAPVPSQLGVSECTGVGTGVGSVGAAWGGERMAQVRVVSEVFCCGLTPVAPVWCCVHGVMAPVT